MRRWILAYSLIIGMYCASAAAQTMFGTEPSTPKEATSNVLSASEFRQKVKSLNNKRQENLNQQFQDQVAKQPSLQDSIPKGPAVTTPSMTNTDTMDKPTATTTPPPPPPQQQAAPYTGFGGSQPTKSAPASNSDSGGGWNVNY